MIQRMSPSSRVASVAPFVQTQVSMVADREHLTVSMAPFQARRDWVASLSKIALGERLPIGRFDAIGFLAEGGMGSVYLAEERDTGWRVALKVLDPRFVHSDEVVV